MANPRTLSGSSSATPPHPGWAPTTNRRQPSRARTGTGVKLRAWKSSFPMRAEKDWERAMSCPARLAPLPPQKKPATGELTAVAALPGNDRGEEHSLIAFRLAELFQRHRGELSRADGLM